jgi:hypothetical protein
VDVRAFTVSEAVEASEVARLMEAFDGGTLNTPGGVLSRLSTWVTPLPQVASQPLAGMLYTNHTWSR